MFAHVLSDIQIAGLLVFNNPGIVVDSFKAGAIV